MKIVITGSLGNISKPLTTELVQKGHTVTVISSDAAKEKEITGLGARAAIGSLEDTDFLTSTFTGNDAIYTMIPPNNYFDQQLDLNAYYKRLGNNYAKAVTVAGIKRQVHLSTIGAHMETGNGILSGAWSVEQILLQLANTAVTFLRPTSFYYNLLGYIPGIKNENAISVNYGSTNIIPWVSPLDIAEAAAEELVITEGGNVRYVASDELSGKETTTILGRAIGRSDLQWKLISNEQVLEKLLAIGMNTGIAAGLVEMYAALESGLLAEDYQRNKPAKMGKVKLTDYAAEFASVYNQ